MDENKLLTISKTFESDNIRTVWNNEEEKYYISVVDVIGILTDNNYQNARNYWKVLKFCLREEGNETVTNCNQLKCVPCMAFN